MAKRVQLICVWCGPVMVVMLIVGFIALAGFIPGPSPSDSPEEIKALYVDNLDQIRAGLCVFMAGMALIAPWGAAIAAQTARGNPRTPVLPFAQLACVAVTTMIGVMIAIAFGAAAFRPDEVSADTTRTLNDVAWLLFIFDWSPLAVWYLAVGLSILTDERDEPAYPRWAAYLCAWTALLSVGGGFTIFFKSGPLAYNGVLALYIPLGVFFIWIVTMSVLTIRAINREDATTENGPAAPARSAVAA